MERCRWRDTLKVESSKRYVVVNVPAFHLWAVCPDSIVDMRVACGAVKTKTPLLTSRITHMEVNPEWSIPMSIIRDDVAHHGGDSAYFARHRYYIADRKTGQRLSPQHVSASMLRSGNYKVAQVGGAGNSLGRIIFRFPNNFSVFLHDTSSPGAFGRDNRGVSHGCVRVQHPFELAKFLLGDDADEQLLDKLRISMGMKPETDWGRDLVDALDPAAPMPKLVSWLKVSPRVPLIISYYTIFLTPNGTLQYYPDVYGYDKVIRESLATYTQ
jgi:murein L,D-transpeptidase YcbB/YkuD